MTSLAMAAGNLQKKFQWRIPLLVVAVFIVSFLIVTYNMEHISLSYIPAPFKICPEAESSVKKLDTGGYNITDQGNHPKSALDYASTPVDELVEELKRRLAVPYNWTPLVFNEPCKKEAQNMHGCTADCPKQLSTDPGTRLREVLLSKELQLSKEQMAAILKMGEEIPPNDYIIASASSSNHYEEMQAMFHSLHRTIYPKLHNFSVVLFDIGLSEEQRETTKKNCKCQVIQFPFEVFPPHMEQLICYAWKPVIQLAVNARARKLHIWQDASIRWDEIQEFIDRAMIYGHQILWWKKAAPSALHTLKQMFDYMHIDPCQFWPYPEIAASIQAHKNDALTVRSILIPAARCAIEQECICPVNPKEAIKCKNKPEKIHRCHRFDQSLNTILLARVFGREMYNLRLSGGGSPIHIKRGDTENYFHANVSTQDQQEG